MINQRVFCSILLNAPESWTKNNFSSCPSKHLIKKSGKFVSLKDFGSVIVVSLIIRLFSLWSKSSLWDFVTLPRNYKVSIKDQWYVQLHKKRWKHFWKIWISVYFKFKINKHYLLSNDRIFC